MPDFLFDFQKHLVGWALRKGRPLFSPNAGLEKRQSREPDDERHVHPLQLDVIERAIILWSNPGEVVLTPFMGVGSEVYGALVNGRRAIGIELKASYFKQAVKNCASALTVKTSQDALF